jgi:hypothetical protein
MALPNPPNNVPQIIDVQNPSSNHHVVSVKMPTNLASKWPSKAWGTPIEDIGLSPKDAALYPDYVLVEVEPIKNTPDLLWIFQKLDGPIWTEKTLGTGSMIPQKFKKQITTTKTEQEVTPITEPTTPLGDLSLSAVSVQKNTGKAVKFEINEEIDENVAPLEGERFAPDGVIIKVEEGIVVEGDPTDKGFLVIQSDVSALGDGKAIKQSNTAKKRETDNDVVNGWPLKQIKKIGQESIVPPKFKSLVVTEETIEQKELSANFVDNIPSPEALTGDQILIETQKINDYRYQERILSEIVDANLLPLNGELTDTWGVNTTEESYVAEGTPAEYGFGTKESKVVPIGRGKSIKSTELYPSDLTSIILHSEEHDQTTGAIISVTKQIVNASNASAIAAEERGIFPYTKFVELKPLDKWHSIMISTTIDELPETQEWTELTQIQFPNELTRVGIIWDAQIDGSESASGTGDEEAIIFRKLSWSAKAEAIAIGSISGRPFYEVKAGKTGSAVVLVTRTFHREPPVVEDITPYSFQSVYGQISIFGGQVEMRTTSSKEGNAYTTIGSGVFYKRSYDTKMVIDTFGPFLHSGDLILEEIGDSPIVSGTYTASAGSTPSSGVYPDAVASVNIEGTATLTLPPSSPILETGDTYVKHIEVKPWRAGVWIKEVYTVTVP